MVAMRAWFVGIQKCGIYGLGTIGEECNWNAVTLNCGHPGNPTLDSAVRELFLLIHTLLLVSKKKSTINVFIHLFLLLYL